MTKTMFNKCLNADMIIFGKLPKDVQDEIRKSGQVQQLATGLHWVTLNNTGLLDHVVYRILPDTVIEPDIEEIPVIIGAKSHNGGLFGCMLPGGSWRSLSSCICHVKFRGIVYTNRGCETTYNDIDNTHGVPLRVRFEKE